MVESSYPHAAYVHAWPAPDRLKTFDVVLALEVLRYLPAVDSEAAWREMLRVLRPGGTIVVTMVNRWPIDGTGCTNDSRPEGPQGAPSLSGPTVSS